MKKSFGSICSLLVMVSSLQAQSLTWDNAVGGNMEDAANWSPSQVPTSADGLIFAAAGDYTVGSLGNMSIRFLDTRGASGTVTFALGANTLTSSLAVFIGQDTDWTSGDIEAAGLQVGVARSSKSFNLQGGTFTASGGLALANTSASAASNSNSVTISNGAKYESATGTVIVGQSSHGFASNGNALTVTGAGSELAVGGGLIVGNLNSNTAGAQANNNSMVVRSGGVASVGSVIIGRRGTGSINNASSGNTLTVWGDGGNSSFSVDTTITIGGGGGGNNAVNVLTGGSFDATGGTTTINSHALGNALNVHGGTYDASGQTIINYGSGKLSVNSGGSVTANLLDLRGILETEGNGLVTLNTLVSAGTSEYRFVLDRENYITLDIAGSATFAGALNLSLNALYDPLAGDSFQLFDFTSATGTFASIALPELNDGLSWDISGLYETGTIQVVPEPTTQAMFIGALLLFAVAWRTKRKNVSCEMLK